MLLRAHFAPIKIEICYRPTASGPCPSGCSPRLLGLAHVSDASPIFNLSFDSYLPDCSLSLKTLPNSVLKTAIYDQKLFKIQPSHVCGCSTNNSNGQMLYLILIQYFQYSICHCTHTDSLQSQNSLRTFDETLMCNGNGMTCGINMLKSLRNHGIEFFEFWPPSTFSLGLRFIG